MRMGCPQNGDVLLVRQLPLSTSLATIPMQSMQGGEAGKIGLLSAKLATLPCMDDGVGRGSKLMSIYW